MCDSLEGLLSVVVTFLSHLGSPPTFQSPPPFFFPPVFIKEKVERRGEKHHDQRHLTVLAKAKSESSLLHAKDRACVPTLNKGSGQRGQRAAPSSNFKPNFDPRSWRYRTHILFQQRWGKGDSVTSPSTHSSSLWGSHSVGMSGTPVVSDKGGPCLPSVSTPSCVCCRQHSGDPGNRTPKAYSALSIQWLRLDFSWLPI